MASAVVLVSMWASIGYMSHQEPVVALLLGAFGIIVTGAVLK